MYRFAGDVRGGSRASARGSAAPDSGMVRKDSQDSDARHAKDACRALFCASPNDQVPMTNQLPMTNDQMKARSSLGQWCLVIDWSLGFGHWSFASPDVHRARRGQLVQGAGVNAHVDAL